jgi:hypothetical protein
MKETLAQHAGLAWALAGALAALVLLLVLGVRQRRRKRAAKARHAQEPRLARAAPPPALDAAALTTAVHEAETRGEREKLPGLYLSLAHCRIEAGRTVDAEDLLRKSIRGAASLEHKETHARARLALGDLAQRSGDLTSACEHWQIARALFFELKQGRDHDAVETRMRRNGCPTDWVLTDF